MSITISPNSNNYTTELTVKYEKSDILESIGQWWADLQNGLEIDDTVKGTLILKGVEHLQSNWNELLTNKCSDLGFAKSKLSNDGVLSVSMDDDEAANNIVPDNDDGEMEIGDLLDDDEDN